MAAHGRTLKAIVWYEQANDLYKKKFKQDLVLEYDDELMNIAFKNDVMDEEEAKNVLEFVKQLKSPLVKPKGFDLMEW